MTQVETIDRGQGRVVVLLHGQPGSSEDWSGVAERLGELRVLIPDRPGYGRTGGDGAGIERNAVAMLQMLDGKGIASATFVGHSWSGAVALWLAESHPRRVEGLVLAASVGPKAITATDRLLATHVLGETLTWAGSHALRRALTRDRVRTYISRRIGDGATGILAAGLDGAAWRTFVVEQRSMIRELPGIERRLAAIAAPTVVLTGDKDRIIPAATPAALVHRIPTARLVTIARAGHALPVEAPDAVARAILSVCAAVAPPAMGD